MILPSLTRFRAWMLALRPGPADHLTECGRSHDRTRRVVWSAMSNALLTCSGLVVSLITIPLTIHYLGSERYGVWVTLSSLLSWLAISDLGFGSVALINALSESKGSGNVPATRAYISTSFFVMVGIAITLGILSILIFDNINWPTVFNVSGAVDERELAEAVSIAIMCFLLMFPGNLVHAVCAGHQETYIAHAWGIVGNISSLVALILVTRGEGNLPSLVMALSGTRMTVVIFSLIYLFGLRYREVTPRWNMVSRAAFARLGHLGWKYLVQNLTAMVMFQSQPILISQMLGPTAVGIYSVAVKLLTLPQVIAQFFLMPLVPAYGEARGRGDWAWMQKMLKRSTKIALATGLLPTIPLMFAAPRIIHIWVGPDLIPPVGLITSLGLYTAVCSVTAALAVYFTGIERIGALAIIGTCNAALTLILAFLFVHFFGLSGMGWAMLAGFAITNFGGQVLLLSRLKRTTGTGEAS